MLKKTKIREQDPSLICSTVRHNQDWNEYESLSFSVITDRCRDKQIFASIKSGSSFHSSIFNHSRNTALTRLKTEIQLSNNVCLVFVLTQHHNLAQTWIQRGRVTSGISPSFVLRSPLNI